MSLALEIKNLTKFYLDFQALKSINLNIKQGDFFALLGKNGAGKSTTIGIISSLLTKTSGTVKVFQNDLDKQPEAVKASIGLVPQDFNFHLFETPIQILTNQAGYYGIPRKIAQQRALKYLKQLDLLDKKNTAARNLSGGMKRRLMIARSLVHQPKLLILDEPTAGVDIEIRRSMWDFLRELNEAGTTIILTTHYLEEAEILCKNIAIIESGKITSNGSMHDVLKKLTKEFFVFDLANNDSKKLKKNEEFEFKQIQKDQIEIQISEKVSLNDIFAYFNQHKIKVVSMRNKTNRLEELFLNSGNK